ncbi:metallophosphoesterase family protein [Sphingomonas rosea]|uniref:Metallophosphoesterase family protein n=1 Tax=Sphingomonas rosea TaxID=335605 RepID=A0ABP7UCM8_9SPHN
MRRFFTSKPAKRRGQDGWRAYVVGDVHGRLDLLDDLLARIEADHANRSVKRGLIVFLGDLIDRGPASAGVVERIRTLKLPGFSTVAITGNHEEVLRRILDGEAGEIAGWLRYGGAETLQSYGLDPDQLRVLGQAEQQERILAAIPEAHRHFYATMADSLRFGDYLLVHAGIRPGVDLDQQKLHDLRWIREPFLSDTRDHGVAVVHGHTISEAVEVVGSRIGIDTGAYSTGRLTAFAIEGKGRWLIDTIDGMRERESSRV